MISAHHDSKSYYFVEGNRHATTCVVGSKNCKGVLLVLLSHFPPFFNGVIADLPTIIYIHSITADH